MTVLRTALYGIGQASTHNVMLGPCRDGAARFDEGVEVKGNPACDIVQMERRSYRSLQLPTPVA